MLCDKLLHGRTLTLQSKFARSFTEAELSEANSHIFMEAIAKHLDEKLYG
jgi:hypothetical protein